LLLCMHWELARSVSAVMSAIGPFQGFSGYNEDIALPPPLTRSDPRSASHVAVARPVSAPIKALI
jgi:hypothetical protein